MRIKKRLGKLQEGDMTPMIDMVFQLIAFFMVLVNFSKAEQAEEIKLPSSELAKPAEDPIVSPITLQVTKDGTVLLGGERVDLAGLRRKLQLEVAVLKSQDKRASDATIIIRADGSTKTGIVQEVIALCQEEGIGFEKFALRAEWQKPIKREPDP